MTRWLRSPDRLAYAIADGVLQPLLPGARAAGDRLMSGRAGKHTAMVGRTLLVRGHPADVAALVAPAVASVGRFEPAPVDGAEVAAWTATSIFGPYPRLVVQPAPTLPGYTEVGAQAFVWQLRFPQGGPFVDRAVSAAILALQAAGTSFTEQARAFAPAAGVVQDGEWRALPLSPAVSLGKPTPGT